MSIEQLIEQLNDKKTCGQALKEIEVRRRECAPLLLDTIKTRLQDYKRIPPEACDYLYAMELLSDAGEQRVFPFLVRFAQLPDDILPSLGYDVVIDDLTVWFVNTYNGDLNELKTLIENEAAKDTMRSAALDALVDLVRQKVVAREYLVDYFKNLMNSELVNDYEFATWLVCSAFDLKAHELYPEAISLFQRNMLDNDMVDESDFQELSLKENLN